MADSTEQPDITLKSSNLPSASVVHSTPKQRQADWLKTHGADAWMRIKESYGLGPDQDTDFRHARGASQGVKNRDLLKGGKEHGSTDDMGQEREMGESYRDCEQRDRIHVLGERKSEVRGNAGDGDNNGTGESENETRRTTESVVASENMLIIIKIADAIESSPSDLDYGMSNGAAGIAAHAGRYNKEDEGCGYEDDKNYVPGRFHASGGYVEGCTEIAYEEDPDDWNCDCDGCCERRESGFYTGCFGDEDEDDEY